MFGNEGSPIDKPNPAIHQVLSNDESFDFFNYIHIVQGLFAENRFGFSW